MDIKVGDTVTTYDGDGVVEVIGTDGTVTVRYDDGEQGWYDSDKFEPATFHPFVWRETGAKSQH